MRLEKRIEEMRLSLESCQEASGSSAYSPTIAGLNSASLDVRKYMVAITCEADRIGKDPTIAKEAFLKTEYAKPSVVASRLPVLVTNVVPPSDVVNKPLSTLPADQSADVKLWQWVHVPGWGSEGHDLFGHGEGSASPTEMMLKIYEWEAAHPGHFARGFNLRGEVKSKIQKWKDIKPSPPGADLYVRVLINDRWTFSPTMDSGGNDFDSGFKADHSIDIDIVEALLALESVPTAVAFNSNGHVKQRVHFPLLPLGRFTGKPHLGLWIRKSALSV